jgi:glycosyltransferase involved in cell wall biosynthesis
MSGAPLFSVIIPSAGTEAGVVRLLDALARQTLPRGRFEIVLARDGGSMSPELNARLDALGARLAPHDRRSGPGAARNRAAALARGDVLALTEDDCEPAPDWLARAAARFDADPALAVLVGRTVKPGGRPVHGQDGGEPLYLPTNLFVRRELFARTGGYCEAFFEPRGNVYFREDSDFGFALEEAGARIAREDGAVVTHPEEHAGALGPLRWARRHMMDPLLARRHPRRFTERIEVHSIGPFRIRRPVVRACFACVIALVLAAAALAAGAPRAAAAAGAVAGVALLPVWAKWRFAPWRLPVVVLVPFALVGAYVGGWFRARRIG